MGHGEKSTKTSPLTTSYFFRILWILPALAHIGSHADEDCAQGGPVEDGRGSGSLLCLNCSLCYSVSNIYGTHFV